MFSAFSPLNGGQKDTYNYPVEYPFDFDAGLDYTRPATGRAIYPFPVSIGYVQGLSPLMNSMEYSVMLGKLSTGPWVGAFPHTQQQLSTVFPDLSGGLQKVRG